MFLFSVEHSEMNPLPYVAGVHLGESHPVSYNKRVFHNCEIWASSLAEAKEILISNYGFAVGGIRAADPEVTAARLAEFGVVSHG